MTIAITAGELRNGIQAAIDLLAAARDGFKDLSENKTVLLDAEQIAQPMASGALSVLLGPLVGPIIVDALLLAIQHNQSAEPGALAPISSGRKGSDPWQE